MVIDRVGQFASELLAGHGTKQVQNGGQNGVAEQGQAVRATLTNGVESIAAMVALAMQAAPARQSRVDDLRAAVQNGSYYANANAVAASMLQEQSG